MSTETTVRLIGAIDGGDHYQADDITALLSTQQQLLTVGAAFTGRPATRIYADAQQVVKIRAELDLNLDKACRWATSVLAKERQLAVYHPKKTWFVAEYESANRVLVGSICPRLTPLHVILKSPPQTLSQRQDYLALLASMFRQYLTLAKQTGHKLDEGLSNYAIDAQGTVYYLDDEHYTWDNFVAFAVMLGVFIRSYEWLDESFIAALARHIADLVEEIFLDTHCRAIINMQLQALFMPSEQKELLLKKLLAVLSEQPSAGNRPASRAAARQRGNDRYYALIADIHANAPALQCTLAYFRDRGINQGLVLGDIVGYGPYPKECIELLDASPFEIIKGNHDHAVATANIAGNFSGNAKTVIDWTLEQLSDDLKQWLNDLPAYASNSDWLAVHGAPIDPAFFNGYVYQLTAEENLDYLQQKRISLCLHGHSHMPGVFARDARHHDHHLSAPSVDLTHYRHALACPGSVGQPRNGVPTAQSAIYDREKRTLDFINLAYPINLVIKKMQDYGLPETLWQRLATGK